jgi:hypothetical protein
MTGQNKGVSAIPINLRLYSPYGVCASVSERECVCERE